jgi:FkbM family methyltransferase
MLAGSLARLGPSWAERVRVFTYNGLVVRLCQGVIFDVRRRGLRLKLHLSDNIQRCLFFAGTYEEQFIRFLENEARLGDTYIDIGAHIGFDAFVVARTLAHSGRIICFEPSPDSAALIRSGAAANCLTELIQVVECGLANEDGRLLLRTDPRISTGDSGVRSRYNEGQVVVDARLRRFDDWAEEIGIDQIDLVKLDIEGSEYQALLGMRNSLIKLRPRAVVVELTDYRLEQAGTTVAMIDQVLAECGYQRSGQVFLENVVYCPASSTTAESQTPGR